MYIFHFASRGQIESDGMSFLLAEENEDATLQEALAFIDAWDAPSITEGGASSGSKRRRGERQRIHDVRRRLRKKEEMLDLRQQAEQLQYQLAQLQHPDSILRDVAMTPCSNYTDGDDTESNSSSSPSRREETSLGLVDKKRRTRMHTEANLAFNAAIGAPSLSFNFDVRLDPLSGPITALTTSTPLNCGIHRAMELLSPKVQIPIDPIGTRSIHVRSSKVRNPNPHFHYEDDRLLITWAAMSFDRCGALCFRECAWILATRSPSNPAQASVVRTHYTLVADKALGCTDIEGEAIDRVRNRALRAIGVQIRDRHSKLQHNFLKSTGQEELAGFACS
ncbi:hypothetical protein BBJ28_00016280 [Nothophytophthora sp. Chile5]|nr:hypothetical protein BBJ28_00016280 [Nothophytophthora sp. Chile5]